MQQTKENLVSVMMSVYNETDSEIEQSINSILNQTYRNIEFIIVIDNPDNDYLNELLIKLAKQDSRIVLLHNEKNLGLAVSMNKAADLAKGEFLARMDADDIADSRRIEKSLKHLLDRNVDVVFTNYSKIDEEGRFLNSGLKESAYIEDQFLRDKIAVEPVIHHPTVVMRKKALKSVNGYRNFPCSQDQDLWLRMLYYGCTFSMLDEILLKYRVRKSSVSNEKRFMQHLTISYICNLFIERLKKGSDSYSIDHYKLYLSQHGYGNQKEEDKFFDSLALLIKAKNCRGINRYWYRVKAFLCSRVYRYSYCQNKYRAILYSKSRLKHELVNQK